MKKVAKIVLIIEMIAFCWTIICPILGFIALKKLNNATQKSELTLMAILNIIFGCTVGGILMLFVSNKDLAA